MAYPQNQAGKWYEDLQGYNKYAQAGEGTAQGQSRQAGV